MFESKCNVLRKRILNSKLIAKKMVHSSNTIQESIGSYQVGQENKLNQFMQINNI